MKNLTKICLIGCVLSSFSCDKSMGMWDDGYDEKLSNLNRGRNIIKKMDKAMSEKDPQAIAECAQAMEKSPGAIAACIKMWPDMKDKIYKCIESVKQYVPDIKDIFGSIEGTITEHKWASILIGIGVVAAGAALIYYIGFAGAASTVTTTTGEYYKYKKVYEGYKVANTVKESVAANIKSGGSKEVIIVSIVSALIVSCVNSFKDDCCCTLI